MNKIALLVFAAFLAMANLYAAPSATGSAQQNNSQVAYAPPPPPPVYPYGYFYFPPNADVDPDETEFEDIYNQNQKTLGD